MIPHSRPWLGEGEEAAVKAVLDSSMLIGGPLANEFRLCLGGDSWQSFLFSSGRVALKAALLALQLPKGSGVVVQTYVCDAVVWAIEQAGLCPVLCDVGAFWVATPETMAEVLTPSCSAILLAPPFGFMQSAADFRCLGLPIVHDLCQASPAIIRDRPKDCFGDVVAFSFHPTKYICASGGGAVLSLHENICKILQKIEENDFAVAPFNNIQCALGISQMEKIGIIKEKRKHLYDEYMYVFDKDFTQNLQKCIDVEISDMFRFVLNIKSNYLDKIKRIFLENGVITRYGVDSLAHRTLRMSDDCFRSSVERFNTTVSVPFYPSLTDREFEKIVRSIQVLK